MGFVLDRLAGVRAFCARSLALVLLGLAARTALAAGPPFAINEIMVDPTAVRDEEGEWLELINRSELPVPLDGLTLVAGGGQAHVVRSLLVVPPGGLVVLGRNGDERTNGGLRLDHVYGGDLLFENAGGELTLLSGERAEVLDTVVYGSPSLAVTAGHALNREPEPRPDPSMLPAPPEPPEARWCASEIPLAGSAVDFGTPGAPNHYCDDDGDGAAEDAGDCDDADSAVGPQSAETCNGVDDNCDGRIDETEWLTGASPCLAVGVCAGTAPTCLGSAAWACVYPADHEPDGETMCDGHDNDCDGETDEGLVNACGACAPPALDVCDGFDNDCDGATDEDAGGPADPAPSLCASEVAQWGGWLQGVCGEARETCGGAAGWTCSQAADVEPGVETLCDERDNDCDGQTDEGLGLGAPCTAGVGACAANGVVVCGLDHTPQCAATAAAPADAERCGDGIDNDCDGATDEGFPVGETCTVSEAGRVFTGHYRCTADGLGYECGASPVVPPDERCGDAVDNDLDGLTDEADCLSDENPKGCAAAPPAAGPLAVLLLMALGARWRSPRRARLG